MQDFYEGITEAIEIYGRRVIGVPYDKGGVFAYTIGNKTKDLPEFVIVKWGSIEIQCMVLNALSEKIAKGEEAFDGAVIDIDFNYPVKIRKASEAAKHELTVQAGEYFGTQEYQLYQVLLPDVEGIFPGEEGFNEKFAVEFV